MERLDRGSRRRPNKELADLQCVFRIHPRASFGEDASQFPLTAKTQEYEPQELTFRARKAHKKSRAGCKNCKKRRIKVSQLPVDLYGREGFC
jgi:hypothetical protein